MSRLQSKIKKLIVTINYNNNTNMYDIIENNFTRASFLYENHAHDFYRTFYRNVKIENESSNHENS